MGGGKRAEVLDELGASHDPQGAAVRRTLDDYDGGVLNVEISHLFKTTSLCSKRGKISEFN